LIEFNSKLPIYATNPMPGWPEKFDMGIDDKSDGFTIKQKNQKE
jgi:hypothetical protein